MWNKIVIIIMFLCLGLNVLAEEGGIAIGEKIETSTYKYTYNWSFNIANATYLPSALPSDMVGYILGTDKSSGVVTEIVRLNFADASEVKSVTGMTSSKEAWLLQPGKNGGTSYFTYTEMSPGEGEGYFASFLATLSTDQAINSHYNAGTSIAPDYSKNLTLVLESAAGQAQFKIAAAAGGSVENLQFAADFSIIPEPTGGMLVLLGLAGLALKRKKAA